MLWMLNAYVLLTSHLTILIRTLTEFSGVKWDREAGFCESQTFLHRRMHLDSEQGADSAVCPLRLNGSDTLVRRCVEAPVLQFASVTPALLFTFVEQDRVPAKDAWGSRKGFLFSGLQGGRWKAINSTVAELQMRGLERLSGGLSSISLH